MMSAVELAPIVGTAVACLALGVAGATYYRRQRPAPCPPPVQARVHSAWALNEVEQQNILTLLREPAYVDKSPRTVYALLLEGGGTWHRYRRFTACCAVSARREDGAIN